MDCLGARGECREFCVWFSGPSTRDEAARPPNRLPFLAMPTDAGRRAEAYRHSWRLPRYSGKIRPPRRLFWCSSADWARLRLTSSRAVARVATQLAHIARTSQTSCERESHAQTSAASISPKVVATNSIVAVRDDSRYPEVPLTMLRTGPASRQRIRYC